MHSNPVSGLLLRLVRPGMRRSDNVYSYGWSQGTQVTLFKGGCTNESCLTHTTFSNSTKTQTTIFYSPPISQLEDSEPSISVTTANLVGHRKWYSEGRNAISGEV